MLYIFFLFKKVGGFDKFRNLFFSNLYEKFEEKSEAQKVREQTLEKLDRELNGAKLSDYVNFIRSETGLYYREEYPYYTCDYTYSNFPYIDILKNWKKNGYTDNSPTLKWKKTYEDVVGKICNL